MTRRGVGGVPRLFQPSRSRRNPGQEGEAAVQNSEFVAPQGLEHPVQAPGQGLHASPHHREERCCPRGHECRLARAITHVETSTAKRPGNT